MPPEVTITNPVLVAGEATVVKPYLQLKGYANELLSSLSYDITNETGLVTNQLVAVVDQFFDTTLFDLTTNYFQGYDIELTNGLNTLTLRVADLAGNVTTTNIDVTLDYSGDTTAPQMTLIWPTNGMHLSGNTFYIRGRIDDETAILVAEHVDGAGQTHTVEGIVERNGMFWVQNLPLTAGANEWTLIATDAAGNVNSTNLSVVQSTVTLEITYTPEGESLYEPSGTVYGTVSDPAYSVTVNGVPATVDEYGNWYAENVPNLGQGTATFDALAEPPGGEDPQVRASREVEMPAILRITKHLVGLMSKLPNDEITLTKSYQSGFVPDANGQWRRHYAGDATTFWRDLVEQNVFLTEYAWSDADPVGTKTSGEDTQPMTSVDSEIKVIPHRSVSWFGTIPHYIHHYYGKGVQHRWPNEGASDDEVFLTAQTRQTLYTGGKAQMARKNLFSIQAAAAEYGEPGSHPWTYTPITPVPPERLRVMGKTPDSQGYVYVVLADNTTQDATVEVPDAKHYYASAGATKHRLFVQANGTILQPDRVKPQAKYCVGQKIDFEAVFNPPVPNLTSVQPTWTHGVEYINHHYTDANGCERYLIAPYWVMQNPTRAWFTAGAEAGMAYVGLNCTFDNGQSAYVTGRGMFSMHRPQVGLRLGPSIPPSFQVIYHIPLGAGPPSDPGITRLKLGIPDGHPGANTSMNFLIGYVSTFDGDAMLTQLCKLDYSGVGPSFDEWRRDGSENYSGPEQIRANAPNENIPFDDNPEWTAVDPVRVQGDFQVYCRFRPDAGNESDNIFVTLGLVTWDCHGETDIWADISVNSIFGPIGPTDSKEFPFWTDTYP